MIELEKVNEILNEKLEEVRKWKRFNLDNIDKDKEFSEYYQNEFNKCLYCENEIMEVILRINKVAKDGKN